jgi:surfeit locus 1 family protein
MYRFLLRPAWIVSHVLVLALIVSMIGLSLWQFDRLDEKKAQNAQIEANASLPPISLDDAIAAVEADGAESMRFRQVATVGRYDPTIEVAIRNRSLDGAPGRWIATPLESRSGATVLIVRGWAALSVDDVDPPLDGVEPPAAPVAVVGYLQTTQERGSVGPTDPADGTLNELARVDVDRVARQTTELAPFWLQLNRQEPPTSSGLLTQVRLPELDEGPHLAYAFQWLIFTIIAIVGYPIILRKVAHQKAAERRAADRSEGDDGEPGETLDGGDDSEPDASVEGVPVG